MVDSTGCNGDAVTPRATSHPDSAAPDSFESFTASPSVPEFHRLNHRHPCGYIWLADYHRRFGLSPTPEHVFGIAAVVTGFESINAVPRFVFPSPSFEGHTGETATTTVRQLEPRA
jgi:hypothetical protein